MGSNGMDLRPQDLAMEGEKRLLSAESGWSPGIPGVTIL